jgi:hypothetical protein
MRIKPGFALLFLITGGVLAQPLASKITVGAPDASYRTAVTGAAGAVEPDADVALVVLDTGHYATARAAADGSFSTTIIAPRGTAIVVKSDPQRAFVKQIADGPPLVKFGFSQLVSLQGTIVRVGVPASPSGVAFAGAGVDPTLNFASWMVEGTVARRQFSPGETIEVTCTYTLLASTLAGAANPRFSAGLTLELLSDPGGRPMTAWSLFDSAAMTPTGLPIERMPLFGSFTVTRPLTVDGAKGTGTFTATYNIPANFPPGYYLLRVGAAPQGVPVPPLDESVRQTTFVSQLRGRENMATVAVLRIGEPAAPRFPALLMLNDSVEGHRGAIAVEDRGRYAPTNHIATATEATIVPRIDPRTGAARRYNLEPFTLSLGVSDRGGKLSGPLVPLRFPSGSLTVTVRAPSGATRTLGPAPLRQFLLAGPVTRDGQLMEGGPHITDAFQLRTLDPSFEVAFTEDGRHLVTVDGTVEDVWGTAWRAGGTYEIDVARPLVIDSAVMPMTPFEVSNQVLPAVQLIPPVPADVDVRVRHGARSARFTGKANRFGHFAPPGWFAFAEAGEYRIDVTASHRDAGGTLWMGTRTWGSVVAPRDTPIIAHGRRGIDAQQGEKQQWYSRAQTGDPMGDHLQFPFHSGDVMWLQESDSTIPFMSFQDTQGATAATMSSLFAAIYPSFSGGFAQFVTKGEIPLFSANSDGRDPSLDPEHAGAWAYSYAAVERPLVRVREVIAEDTPMAYWRFNDRYGAQTGSGVNGDLPNDFKFQFGGVVLRGPLFDPPRYAIYGSLFVLVPTDDPGGGSRVFPPFQGNGSGPTGGPLFKLKGKDVDLFFHPTGVRAGTVLVQGDTASFAGYSAPALPSKIAIDVTAPSGRVRTIKGQANRIGWFYDAGSNFAVDEPGVWKAKVTITFDGVLPSTSGQVTAPFPTGGVLGSRDGEYYFYVVRGDAASVATAAGQPGAAAPTQFLRPADGPITFTVTPPPGLHDLQLTYTTTMPGFVLEEGTTSALTYTYDAPRLALDFPNLDLNDHEGFGGADVITTSLLVSGTDAAGKRRHAARTIVIAGEELMSPAQPPAASPARRRAAR